MYKKLFIIKKYFKAIPILLIFLLTIIVILETIYLQNKDYGKYNQANYETEIMSQLLTCTGTNIQKGCQAQVANKLRDKFTIAQILGILEKNKGDPTVNRICHAITHDLGRIEYKRTGDLSKVFNNCQHACYEGCFHGATEAYFLEKNIPLDDLDNKSVQDEIPKVCGRREKYSSYDFFVSCLHGLGHAIMFVSENDLPKSLKSCDLLPERGEQEGCYSGVFMENSQAEYNKDHPSDYIDAKNHLFPCTILEEKYLEICYRYQGSHVLRRQGSVPDFRVGINFCNSVPKNYRISCINHISGHITGYSLDSEGLKKLCDLFSQEEDKKACIKGIASRLLQQSMGENTNSRNFCDIQDETNKEFCLEFLQELSEKR